MENKTKISPFNIQLGEYVKDIENLRRLCPDMDSDLKDLLLKVELSLEEACVTEDEKLNERVKEILTLIRAYRYLAKDDVDGKIRNVIFRNLQDYLWNQNNPYLRRTPSTNKIPEGSNIRNQFIRKVESTIIDLLRLCQYDSGDYFAKKKMRHLVDPILYNAPTFMGMLRLIDAPKDASHVYGILGNEHINLLDKCRRIIVFTQALTLIFSESKEYPDEKLVAPYMTQLGNILSDYDLPLFVKFLRKAF